MKGDSLSLTSFLKTQKKRGGIHPSTHGSRALDALKYRNSMNGLVAPAAGTNQQLGLGFGLRQPLTAAAGNNAQLQRSVEARRGRQGLPAETDLRCGGGGEREGAGCRVLRLGAAAEGGRVGGGSGAGVGGDQIKPPWVGGRGGEGREKEVGRVRGCGERRWQVGPRSMD